MAPEGVGRGGPGLLEGHQDTGKPGCEGGHTGIRARVAQRRMAGAGALVDPLWKGPDVAFACFLVSDPKAHSSAHEPEGGRGLPPAWWGWHEAGNWGTVRSVSDEHLREHWVGSGSVGPGVQPSGLDMCLDCPAQGIRDSWREGRVTGPRPPVRFS